MRSVSVVFPESMCAEMPMFRIRAADAKHRSAAHTSDCCPNPMHKKDGLAPETYGSYRYVREEAHGDYKLVNNA